MALSMNVRVRLDLRQAISKFELSSLHPLCWISVDKSNILDIRGLKTIIKSRYNICEEAQFQLYLQNCLLPDDESIDLLRDDDLLKCILFSYGNSEEQKNAAYSGSSSKVYDTSKKRNPEKDDDSNATGTMEDVDFSKESEKKKKRKRKLDDETKQNLEENDAIDNTETEIIPQLSPLDSRSTEREELLKMLSRIRGLPKKSKASNEYMPARNEQSPQQTVQVPDKSNSSRQIDNSLQTEETQSANVDKLAGEVCNGSTVSNLDTSYNSCKNSDKELQFQVANGVENENKFEKKKRKRRRRNKCSTVLPISTPPSFPCELTPVSSSEVSFPNRMGRHIRFDDVSSSLVATDTPSENQPTDGQNTVGESTLEFNDASSSVTSAFNQVPDSEIMSRTPYESKTHNYQELSKDKQINSVCTNKSIILLNCFGAYPDDLQFPNQSSTVDTLTDRQNTCTSKSIVITKPKYEDYPQLKGPPRIGDHIAFKILELSETYCPEVSQFKEGKVVKCENDILDVKLFGDVKKKYNKGKFELVYSDEENRTEGTWNDNVQISWSDMIEPRLLNAP